MRFKDFIDIDSIKHAKIEEKPVKNYKGDYKALSISKPKSNGSNATYDELKEMQEIFENRTSEMEKSVEDHINSLDIDVQAYSPTQLITKQWKDRKKKVLAPLLPKIVLVKTIEKLREQVFIVPGTVRYLFEQKKPAIVRQNEIDELKLITDNKRIIDHQVLSAIKGDEVDLTNYGFKNIKGIIDKVSKEVCWVKLDSLGCTLKLTLKK